MSYTSVVHQQPSASSGTFPTRSAVRSRKPRSARSEALTKLRNSYSSAARAFLHHRIDEAHNLVEEAFQLLHPPSSHQSDQLSAYRRKWDILRITLETTLYTTGDATASTRRDKMLRTMAQSSTAQTDGPDKQVTLRSTGKATGRLHLLSVEEPRTLPPPSLLGALHTRSLILFTPSSDQPSSRYLPAAVLVALVLASLKLECPQVGRGMTEDWLENREPLGLVVNGNGLDETKSEEREGYEKVIEVYCLHVLPRLNEWVYAKEFLDSEMEMKPTNRQELTTTLASHHAQSLLPPSPRHGQLQNLDTSVSGSSGAPTPRAVSPTPSSVSSHTAVPNSRPVKISAPPMSPTSTVTPRPVYQPANPIPSAPHSSTIAIPPPAPSLSAQPTSPQVPTIIQLLKAALIPYLRRLNAPVLMLALVLSFLGLVTRFGRKPKGPGSGAEMARRRLTGSGGIWSGLVDAVKMSGRGLV